MNRRHTRQGISCDLERVRRARPDIAFSSDFIVGFPGETDADFEATLALVREVGLRLGFRVQIFIAAGTPAAEADEQVAEEVKVERLAGFEALLEAQRQAFNHATVGQPLRRRFRQARPA